jgi:diguanylate cyclase
MELSHYLSSLLSPPMMLAVVATIGYWIGRRRLKAASDDRTKNRQEVLRALSVAQELESITNRLRKSISSHVPAVVKFNSKLSRMEECDSFGWQDLSDRANELLKPALRLSAEISNAHSSILQQMTQLSLFAELRTDPLTSVANRRAFDDSLDVQVKQFGRYGLPVSIVMLDIDFFKRVNDQHGHMQGDLVLRELAELLRVNLRECDMVARYGGEEFAVVMPHTQLVPAARLAERLRAAVEDNLAITASLGVAELLGGDTPATIVQRSDRALYQAKVNGRNCVYVHEGPSNRIVDVNSFLAKSANEPTRPTTASLPRVAPAVADSEAKSLVECHDQAE